MNLKEVAELMDKKGRFSILKLSAKQKTKYQEGASDPMHWQSFANPSYKARIEISSPDKDLLLEIQRVLGVGAVSTTKSNNYSTYAAWNKAGRQATVLLAPFLKEKKPQANLIKTLDSLHKTRTRPLSTETMEAMEQVYQSIKELNSCS